MVIPSMWKPPLASWTHIQPVAAWMPRWEFYYCNLQMLWQNKIVTTMPPCRIFSVACFILGDPHPQEQPGPQLNSQPAFLILVKYLCGVGLFAPRWWAEIRGRYPEFGEQRWKCSSIGNMPCIAESQDDKFEPDRSTGWWFEASFEACLLDVKSSPKLDQRKKSSCQHQRVITSEIEKIECLPEAISCTGAHWCCFNPKKKCCNNPHWNMKGFTIQLSKCCSHDIHFVRMLFTISQGFHLHARLSAMLVSSCASHQPLQVVWAWAFCLDSGVTSPP